MSRKGKSVSILFTAILVLSFIFTAIQVNTRVNIVTATDNTDIVYVDPANTTDLTLTPPAEKFSLTIRPDGEGTDDDWYEQGSSTPGSADYTNWDEASANDADYNWIDDEGLFQGSTLADSSGESWSIAKVKLTVRAKSNQYSDDGLYPMLVLGGKGYDGVKHLSVSTSYTEYTSIWGMNPATQDQWTWSEIDSLEAGVWTDSGDDFTWDSGLEIYVSQLYVEVFGPGIKFDVNVDYVSELSEWQFDLYYNPDVLNGVYADEGTGATVGFDPDGFLASEGGTIVRAPGVGWDNTLGKMWLSRAYLSDGDKNVTGGGRLASIMFEPVGKGETNLTLGSLTLLFADVTIWPTLERGYFRNVAKADLPTASFTYSPMGTPEPLEGYYTEFNGTGSTATSGKTIDEYKWYFWKDYSKRSVLDFDEPNKLRPDGDGTYTDWINNWDDWNDTKDDTYVYANADDMYESSTLQDHATEIYNVGKVNVTIAARTDVPTSDEKVQIMLVIGGTRYYGKSYTVTITQTEYTSEWATNPATGSAWTWSDIDSLEAGVRSLQEGASWTGEIRVSQLHIRAIQTPIVDVDVDTIYQNVTRSGTWNVTLTVTDSDGVVGSTTQEVTIKAHDVAVVDVTIDAPIAQWPGGDEYVDIGEILTINITVENQGDFAEQHSPSSNFTVTAYYQVTLGPGEIRSGIIGTVNVTTPLAAGARANVTFQWDTDGHNATHPNRYWINANVTTVQYEYELRDNLLEYSERVRVRFHDVAITEIEVYPHRTLRPDGDGTFTEWTGTYADWDDWPEHNEDVDYISATADAMNESSTLEDHTIETWSIERVRVTVFARATSLPSEQLILMLVIGGEAYDATGQSLTLSYSEHSYDWETNPATGSDWTWQDIDLLEVGVRSQEIGAWTGEIRVTQLYVEVSGAAPGPVSRGEITPVLVTVKNEGDFNETAISVTAYYDESVIGTQTIHLLTNESFGQPPNFAILNYTVTLTFDWDTSGISLDEYTISANTSLVPDDYEPYDNTYVNGNINVTAPPEPSTISIEASPASVMVGEIVTVNGSITPVRAGATVTIWYRASGAATWSNLTSVVTDGTSQYSYDWTTTTGGTFELMASWPGDVEYQPAGSSVVTVVVNKLDSVISIEASPASVMVGEIVTVNGSITPVRAGATVTIWYRASGAATWSNLTSVVTNDTSQYSYDWTTTTIETFELMASWAGDAEYLSAESSVITVVVGKMSSSITISASQSTITIGDTATLSGSLTPARQGENINIQYRIGGGSWNDLTSVVTDDSGEYSYEWTQTEQVGTFELMASWAGDAEYLSAESSVTVVVGKMSSSITITISPTSITLGDHFTISGAITPPLAHKTVTVYYKTDVADWMNLLSAFQTDENGEFSVVWSPTGVGGGVLTYEFKVTWKGDAITEGAESNIVSGTVRSEEEPDFTLLVVAAVVIIVVAVVLIYFLKVRKKS